MFKFNSSWLVTVSVIYLYTVMNKKSGLIWLNVTMEKQAILKNAHMRDQIEIISPIREICMMARRDITYAFQ